MKRIAEVEGMVVFESEAFVISDDWCVPLRTCTAYSADEELAHTPPLFAAVLAFHPPLEGVEVSKGFLMLDWLTGGKWPDGYGADDVRRLRDAFMEVARDHLPRPRVDDEAVRDGTGEVHFRDTAEALDGGGEELAEVS
jgi:hypothetical protein